MKAKLVCLACILIAVGPPFMGGSTAFKSRFVFSDRKARRPTWRLHDCPFRLALGG